MQQDNGGSRAGIRGQEKGFNVFVEGLEIYDFLAIGILLISLLCELYDSSFTVSEDTIKKRTNNID